jgi:poly(3-hydroxybutyrate) depolymerase
MSPVDLMEARPPALNDLSVAMGVIGLPWVLREPISTETQLSVVLHGRTTTPKRQERGYTFLITAREGIGG